MNYISNKLYKSFIKPAFPRIQRPIFGNYVTWASAKTKDGVVGKCLRALFYRRKNIPVTEERSLSADISAYLGEVYQYGIEQLIIKHGFGSGIRIIDTEYSVHYPEYHLVGRIDILAWDTSKKEPIIIEVKSVGDWESKNVVERPNTSHVMQVALYLYILNQIMPGDSTPPQAAYIVYCARSENWDLKKNKHGSPFVYIWDYTVRLEGDKILLEGHDDFNFTIKDILDRYEELDKYIERDEVPPRDYQLRYDEETIVGMYKNKKLKYKKDQAIVERWLKKGAKKGELKLSLGDSECHFCDWQSLCWKGVQGNNVLNFNLPERKKDIPAESRDDIL